MSTINREEIRARIEGNEARVTGALETMRAEMAEFRADMKTEMASLRVDLEKFKVKDFNHLQSHIAQHKQDVWIDMGGILQQLPQE